jgi:hypothetical protein
MFEPFFAQLEAGFKVNVWHDGKIAPGTKWRFEIQKAIDSARIALLLVSQDYLASPFIREVELPSLLDAAKPDGLAIWWLPLSSCMWEDTPIAEYQALIDKPLAAFRGDRQRSKIQEICERVKRELRTKSLPSDVELIQSVLANETCMSQSDRDALPKELLQPIQQRYLSLSAKQKTLLSTIAKLALRTVDGRGPVPLKTIEAKYRKTKRSEMFYRLEQLRLLGFILVNADESGDWYRLSDLCERALGRVLIGPPRTR